jgi:hypothetical protein
MTVSLISCLLIPSASAFFILLLLCHARTLRAAACRPEVGCARRVVVGLELHAAGLRLYSRAV